MARQYVGMGIRGLGMVAGLSLAAESWNACHAARGSDLGGMFDFAELGPDSVDLTFDVHGVPFIALVTSGRFGNIVKAGYWDGHQWVLTSVNAESAGYAERPSLAVDSEGTVSVTWEEPSCTGAPVLRHTKRFTDSGWAPAA